MPRVAVVVAKYKESVDWVGSLPAHWDVFVYDKSTPHVPNKGREAETYARFVDEHYDELHRWECVVFLQGNPFDHLADTGLPDEAHTRADALEFLGALHTSDAHGYPDHPGLPVAELHTLVFEDLDVANEWTFVAGAQFTVPVPALLRRPREFWRRLHDLLFREVVDAWTMERLWTTVFGHDIHRD